MNASLHARVYVLTSLSSLINYLCVRTGAYPRVKRLKEASLGLASQSYSCHKLQF